MKLVDDASRAWRWFSVQIAALLAVLPLAWAELPGDVKAYLPPEWRPWIVTGLAVGIIAGRLIKQGPAK